MKRLFKLGLLALMGVCGFVGISRANVETAKSAVLNDGMFGVYAAPNFVPELTAAKPVLKVLALDEDEAVIADNIVVYVEKEAPTTPLDVTFDPESGSTVPPGTRIKLGIADLQDNEELDYCWFKTKEEAEAAEWAIDWSSGDDPEVYLERGLDKDTLYLKVVLLEVDDERPLEGTVKGYSVVATYFVDAALANNLTVTPDGTEPVDENDEVTVTVNFGGEEIEGTIVYKWYATMNEANADETLLTTATVYAETAKPVITKAKPVLSVGYKNADGWLIIPVTIEYTFSAFTFNPETGSTVAPGTKITVTAKLREDQRIDYKWCSSEEEAEAAEWDWDWNSCEDEQPVAVLDPRSTKDKDTLYLKVTMVTVVENADEDGNWKTDVDGYALAMYIVDKALENKLVVVPNGVASVKENDTVTVTVNFGGEKIEGTIVYKWYATMDEANADTTLLTTATAYVETAKPVITKAKPVLTVGYKNAEGWVIMPLTIEYTIGTTAVENSELAGVNVYPNPNAGAFNVAVPERARIDIFGLNGAKVLSREVNAGVEAFNLEHSGIYFVRVMAGNKTAVKRVVVR